MKKNHGFFVSNYSFLKLHTRDRVTDDVTETLKKENKTYTIYGQNSSDLLVIDLILKLIGVI